MENEDSYISLRKSLDSFSDVALNEFALIKSDAGKQEFSDFVSDKVKGLLREIAIKQQAEWRKLNPDRAKDFQAHAEKLSENPALSCPPGFHEVDGICVRI